MKQVLAILACLFIGHAVASANPIRVHGTGTTFEDAKLSAFRTAVELQSGSVIVSSVEVSTNQLVQNEILNHSAGYVDDYKVISTQTLTNQVLVVMDVWISSSKLSNKILGVTSGTNNIDGSRHQTQYQSLMTSLQQRDRVVAYVLNDFPKKAFNVSLVSHQFSIDGNRNPSLVVKMAFEWNYNYLTSFSEMLSLTTENKDEITKPVVDKLLSTPLQNYITVMGKDPSALLIGNKAQYRIQDNVTYNKIQDHIAYNPPRVKMEIVDTNNKLIFADCWEPENMEGKKRYYTHGKNIVFFGNRKESTFLTLELTDSLQAAMKSFSKINLTVVSAKECNN